MTIEFSCPECQKTLRTGDDKAGKTAKCPGCGNAITVPGSGGGSGGGEQFDYEDYGEEDYGDDYGADEFSDTGFPPRSGGSGKKACPMCGEQIKAAAVRCRFCGEYLEDHHVSTRSPRRDSSLAVISLVSGITGLVFTLCCGCISIPGGLTGIITGIIALNRVKAGEADGKGMAIAGIVCGAITLLIFVLLIVFGVAMEMQKFPRFNP